MVLRSLPTRLRAASAFLVVAIALPAAAGQPLPTTVKSASPQAISEDDAADAPQTPHELAPPPTIEIGEEPNGSQLSDGSWVHRTTSGQALAGGTYRRGVREGLWVRFFAPGEGAMFATESFREFQPPFRLEAQFKDGRLTGKCTAYDANRRMAAEWDLRDDVVHGKATWYFADGSIRQQDNFRHGFLHGERTVWNAQGEVIEKLQYSDGLRFEPHEEHYTPNAVRSTGGLVDTSARFEATFNWWRGIAATVGIPGEQGSAKHGDWLWRYETGHEMLQGTYHEGRPTGVFTWWYENGQKQLSGTYVDGQPCGDFVWWHSNGQKQLSATYVDGLQMGTWMRWDAEGIVEAKGDTPIDPLGDFLSTGEPTTRPASAATSEPQEMSTSLNGPPASRLKKKLIVGGQGRLR